MTAYTLHFRHPLFVLLLVLLHLAFAFGTLPTASVSLLVSAAWASDGMAPPAAKSGKDAAEPEEGSGQRSLAEVVRAAFKATHDGWSADEVIINDKLNTAFIAACRKRLPSASEFECNWTLLNLRKSGRLGVRASRRRSLRHEEYFHAAEIAARYVFDKYKVSIDRALCHPKYRAEFDRVARSVAPNVSAYRLRKAALGLRKARRLRPELVARIADWGKEVLELSAEQIAKDPSVVPAKPGVYIFRDKSGYLYIGESSNLRKRLSKHLADSDRPTLASYLSRRGYKDVVVELHAFDPASRARERMVRRAYESELIRSRRPRFNIAP